MYTKLGIPYMGSKRKLAKSILDVILEQNPNCKYFYDLFGGGGAVSFEALQRPQIERVCYNEIDTTITELLNKVLYEGVSEEFYQWIDRETFNKNNKGKDWFAGFVKTVWSFGNRTVSYIYGKNIEEYKKLLHDIVVHRSKIAVGILHEKYGVELDYKYIKNNYNMDERRLYIIQNELREELKSLKHINRLPHIERLQHLKKIQCLQRKETLIISNKSYEQVIIDTPIHETIIYLDPPYKNTTQYQHRIDYEKLHEYIVNSPYKIYVSSYNWDGLYEIASFNHRCTLSATNKNKRVVEKLYCNKPRLTTIH
ncbi:MAG TPA: DNA adenine methylase [Candidatus Pacearchaeota archaeon]|nr:DNA adenine methylase [Candidatus Pacearchaeota archaeon]